MFFWFFGFLGLFFFKDDKTVHLSPKIMPWYIVYTMLALPSSPSVKEMLFWIRSRTQAEWVFHFTAATVTHNWCVACVIVALLFFQIILVVQSILLWSLQAFPLFSPPLLWNSDETLFMQWETQDNILSAPLWDMIALILLIHFVDQTSLFMSF